MIQDWVIAGVPDPTMPTIHIVSDSVGVTATAVARAAAAGFGNLDPQMMILPPCKTPATLIESLDKHVQWHEANDTDDRILLFYTFAEQEMNKTVEKYTKAHPNVVAVDILGPSIRAISEVTGLEPTGKSGFLHSVNEHYFHRIEAMEFTISHDDGRNPQDLTKADIVLLGVSRSSKTPLSIYLSQLGYKVANVPLDPLSEPPAELFDVDPTRLFGLIISPDILVGIRKKRLGNASQIAASYADLECVYQDLEKARDLMRKLGCIVIRTDNRAIEETAQEVLRYYRGTHAS